MAKLGPLVACGRCRLRRRTGRGPPIYLPPVSRASVRRSPTDFSGWYLRGDVGAASSLSAPNLQIAPDPIATGVPTAACRLRYGASTTPTLSPFAHDRCRRRLSVQQLVPRSTARSNIAAAPTSSRSIRSPTPATPYFGGPRHMRRSIAPTSPRSSASSTAMSICREYWGVTPFVGAGLGFADNMLSRLQPSGIRRLRLAGAGRYFAKRIEDQLRLGADGRRRFRHHPEPQAGARLPLSELRLDRDRRLDLRSPEPAGAFNDSRALGGSLSTSHRASAGLERLPHRPHLDAGRTVARRAVVRATDDRAATASAVCASAAACGLFPSCGHCASSGSRRLRGRALGPPAECGRAPLEGLHDRRDCAKGRAPPLRLGQPDPAARSDHADLGGPLDRRPTGRRPDRADDADLPALGAWRSFRSLSRPARRFAATGRARARDWPYVAAMGALGYTASTRSSILPRTGRARSISRSSRARSRRWC